ncbi:hypothetical protein XENOCAPTIV_029513, partial [Xenoophorus captivus]
FPDAPCHGPVFHGTRLGAAVFVQLYTEDTSSHGHVESIDEELDRRAFQSVFETVASPGSPYHQLLGCLQSIHQEASL